jgi:NADH dehydrogenase
MAVTFAVIGCTGFVGRNFSRYAAEKGASVLNISREHESPGAGSTGTFAMMNLHDSERLGDCLKAYKTDVVYNFVGISKQHGGDTYDKVNAGIAKSVASACKHSGAQRLVHMSGLGVAHLHDSAHPRVQNDYFRSLAAAEKAVREAGVDFTIFRPSYIVGKDDLFTLRLKPDIERGFVRTVGRGSERLQPIFVEDACEILYKAPYFAGTDDASFDLVGPEKISFMKYAQMLADGLHGRPVELTYRAMTHSQALELGMSQEQIDIRTCDETGDSDWLQKVFDIRLKKPEEFFQMLYPKKR